MAQQRPNIDIFWQLALQANRREDHTTCFSICTAILSQPGLTLFELGQTSNVLSRLPARLGALDHVVWAIKIFERVSRGDGGSSVAEQTWATRGIETAVERFAELSKEGDGEEDWNENKDEDEGTVESKRRLREELEQQGIRRLTRQDVEHPQPITAAKGGVLKDRDEGKLQTTQKQPKPPQSMTPGTSTQEHSTMSNSSINEDKLRKVLKVPISHDKKTTSSTIDKKGKRRYAN